MWAALLLLAWALTAACDDADNASPPPTATTEPLPTQPSPTPVADLAESIGVRGELPPNDAIDLAERYGLTPGRAPSSKPFAGEATLGDDREFLVQRISAAAYRGDAPPENATITAMLLAKSDHAYFYVDDALDVGAADAQAAADAFERGVWPEVTRVFGLPAIPGVDGDPRIIVLQTDLGGAVGGYYSPDDAFLRSVRRLSNEAEMVYLDQSLRIGGAAFNVVLAHELQHLVHAHLDSGEEAWVNEGLAEAASALVGGAMSSVESFAAEPAIQLNTWSSEDSSAHYGAGAAFTRYLAHRFGGNAALGEIAAARSDGAAGIDEFLAGVAGVPSFRDVFADWIAANALDRVEGPYGNPGSPLDLRIEDTLAPGDRIDAEATQFGTDYYLFEALEDVPHTLRFEGSSEVAILPTTSPAGGPMLWSNAQDDVDTTLTRAIDLTDATTPALTFRTWFKIEPWYDWGYVAVSTDGGNTWRALAGANTTDDDPVEVAYGPGYTDTSGGADVAEWVDERISLAEFAGQRILLRFEYVTDGSTHGDGWAVDDIAIEGTGLTDLDGTDPDWDFDGWVRIDRALPQTWIVRLIAEGSDGEPVVLDARISPGGTGTLTFDTVGLQDVVVAVAASTEGTTQRAPYSIELLRE